jgi:integrase
MRNCKDYFGLDLEAVLPYQGELKDYPTFSDADFKSLYDAFADAQYPKFIISGERYRYWQAILHFVAITAVRRQAVLGMTIKNINFDEQYITVESAIDKAGKTRYKPITPDLANELLELIRFYDYEQIGKEQHGLLFPWTHGTKAWYKVWNAAETKIGKRFHLHDLKRFSGELALRAGAKPLELMQHMDHASLTTTMKHYCRPVTKELVKNMKVPIPNRAHRLTPMFTEPELQDVLLDTMRNRLALLGLDMEFILDRFGLPVLPVAETADIDVSKKGGKNSPLIRLMIENGGAI